MTTRLLRPLALVLLALAGPAAAQAPTPPAPAGEVLVDGWSARWVSGKKVGWTHETIAAVGAGEDRRLHLTTRSWRLVDEGEPATSELRVVTDGAGKVLLHEETSRGPWGVQTVRLEGAAYRVQVREVVSEGQLEGGDVWSPSIVTHLVVRGAQPPGKRTLRVAALPGEGAKERDLTVKREGQRWRVEGADGKSSLDAQGRLERFDPGERAGELELAAASEAEARDLGQPAPAGLPPPVDEVELSGVRVRRPAGQGWSLLHKTDGEKMQLVGLEHPGGHAVVVVAVPLRLPKDDRLRMNVAETMQRSINAQSDGKLDGPRLGAPELVTWRDRPAAHYAVSGTAGMTPARGDAYLLDGDGTTLLVLFLTTKDRWEPGAAERARSEEALQLVRGAAVAWERVDLGGATLEVPSAWAPQKDAPQSRVSPMGASRVRVGHDTAPPGLDPAKAQSMWASMNKQNATFQDFVLTRHEDLELSGRTASVCEWTARMKETNGVQPRVRSASCMVLLEDGTYVEVVIVAFDLDFDLEAVDRMLGSIQWKEAAAIDPH